MQPDFWHQRWQDKRTGFHQDRPTPLMLKHWPALALRPGSRVFVPLAGKSLDMAWLADQGYRVLGVDLSQTAIEAFFAGQKLTPRTHDSDLGHHYCAGNIEIICGDVFALDDDTLAGCDALFDRAALIALPPAMRQRYASQVHSRLPSGCQGLLITLEYPQAEMSGPPFSVPEAEIRERFGGQWNVQLLERRDILAQQPGMRDEGLTALATVVYRLDRR